MSASRVTTTTAVVPVEGNAVEAVRVRVTVSDGLRAKIRAHAGDMASTALKQLGDFLPGDAREFAALERRLAAVGAERFTAPVLQDVLTAVNADEEFVEAAVARAREERPLKIHSHRDIPIKVLDGGDACVTTPYATPPPPPASRPGRRRGVGHRGPTGNGAYPVLAQLGFLGRLSPALSSEVARAAAELASYVEAEDSMKARGLDLDDKTVCSIAHRVADAGLEARLAEDDETEELKGKRVVVALDGGRLRTRVSGKRGRRRTATGARGYETPWREPQLLAIYTVDEKGKKTGERPWYEATLSGWDELFRLATKLLRRLGAKHAAELVVCGDGASHIWDRVDGLLSRIEIDRSRVRLFADFWHAVEYITKAADLVKDWSPEHRARWRRARRRELYDGKVDVVIARIGELAVGRRAAAVHEVTNYFRNHRDLMHYDELRAAKLPIGSGAVESAIRRVINLRLKGPGCFWEEPNAERMLLLRCRLKSGRWDELEEDVYRRASATHGRVLELERRMRIVA